MCRLYAMHANEPTRVECGLVIAQNALMAQSKRDMTGYSHGHGWGVADYNDGLPLVEKQTWAAFHGAHFAKKAAKVYARTVGARRSAVRALKTPIRFITADGFSRTTAPCRRLIWCAR